MIQDSSISPYWVYLQQCTRHQLQPDYSTSVSLYTKSKSLHFSRNCEGQHLIPVLELADECGLTWIEELHCHSKRMCTPSIDLLAKLCEALPQLKSVDISGSLLGDENSSIFCEGIGNCTMLQELKLAHCKLRIKTTEVLAQLLGQGKWPMLQSLDIRNNLLTQKDIELLRNRSAVSIFIVILVIANIILTKARAIVLWDDGNQIGEEVLNSVTHGVGFISSMIAGSNLTIRSQVMPHFYERLGIFVYVFSLCLMFASSTLYHSFFRLVNTKRIFRIMDHCSIFVLIAGTYTPFLQKYLWYPRTWIGPIVMVIIWLLALLGILLSAGWFQKKGFSPTLRLVLAIVMGWLVIGTIKSLREQMPSACFGWVLMGGIFYSVGIPFYMQKDHTLSCHMASLVNVRGYLSLYCS
eukprot:jgi/Galph1/3832/GphlegSOOS_G2498.1